MNSVTAQSSVLEIPAQTANPSSSTRGLIAKWIKVDGKLMCQWHTMKD